MSAQSLKPGWKVVLLGEVVNEISNRVSDPSQSGYERFVGLEHFETGELEIRKWESTDNLVSSMKLCSKGDTLFARRNAYLKRTSLVDFDGVCWSSPIYPVKTKWPYFILPPSIPVGMFLHYHGWQAHILACPSFFFLNTPLPAVRRLIQVLAHLPAW